jgi:hypothetical protein
MTRSRPSVDNSVRTGLDARLPVGLPRRLRCPAQWSAARELRQHRGPTPKPLPIGDKTTIVEQAPSVGATEGLDVPPTDLALPADGLHDPEVLLARRPTIAQHEHLMLNHHIEVEEARYTLAVCCTMT